MLLSLRALILLFLFEFSIIIWVLNFTDSHTSREQSRKREIYMFQYNLDSLLSPWFVAGSHSPTGGHFACACVNPLNDNSVGASNLMAGNRKLARRIPILLKAISLVL